MADTSTMPVTADEAMEYLAIDYADDAITRNVERMILAADATMAAAIGKDYPRDDPRARELCLMYVEDMYTGRGIASSGSATDRSRRKLAFDFELQLKLELSLRREAEQDGEGQH